MHMIYLGEFSGDGATMVVTGIIVPADTGWDAADSAIRKAETAEDHVAVARSFGWPLAVGWCPCSTPDDVSADASCYLECIGAADRFLSAGDEGRAILVVPDTERGHMVAGWCRAVPAVSMVDDVHLADPGSSAMLSLADGLARALLHPIGEELVAAGNMPFADTPRGGDVLQQPQGAGALPASRTASIAAS